MNDYTASTNSGSCLANELVVGNATALQLGRRAAFDALKFSFISTIIDVAVRYISIIPNK